MLVALTLEQIYQRCDLAELDFADTTELASAERERIEENIARLQLELQKVVSQLPMLKREASREIQALNKGITRLTVEQFVVS